MCVYSRIYTIMRGNIMHVLSLLNLIYTDQVYKKNSTKIKRSISWENFYKKELFSSNFLNAWFVRSTDNLLMERVPLFDQCAVLKINAPFNLCTSYVFVHYQLFDRDCFVRYIFISLYLYIIHVQSKLFI